MTHAGAGLQTRPFFMRVSAEKEACRPYTGGERGTNIPGAMSHYPPPIPPVPVQALSVPVSVARAYRPRLVVLIGAMSIVVGVFSMLVNAGLSLSALAVYRMTTRIAQMTAPPP